MRQVIVLLSLGVPILSVGCGGRVGGGSYDDRIVRDGSADSADPAPNVTCPSPSTVVPGAKCEFSSMTYCVSDRLGTECGGQSTGAIACACIDAQWACAPPGHADCIDAGAPSDPRSPADATALEAAGPLQDTGGTTLPPGPCPSPGLVVEDVPCTTPNQTCPGNPAYCGGALFYDALQCQADGRGALLWHTLAATLCGERDAAVESHPTDGATETEPDAQPDGTDGTETGAEPAWD